MSRIEFDTGMGKHVRHQKEMIRWVRRRLADQQGKEIRDPKSSDRWTQRGVMIADGVGMGKTWEALGAAAVLLYKWSLRRKDGVKRDNTRRKLGRVLIVVPPNLVEKWSGEIHRRDKQNFHSYLKKWYGGNQRRRFVFETLASASTFRLEKDLQGRGMSNGHMALNQGTFIVSNRLIAKKKARKRLCALRDAPWDVVIIDEAHHRITDRILRDCLRAVKQGTPVLLLSATPFQLGLNELRPLFDHLGKKNEGSEVPWLINAQSLKDYLDAAKSLTAESDATKFSRGVAAAASRLLRQIMSRNSTAVPGQTKRHYYYITKAGSPVRACLYVDSKALSANLSSGAIRPSPEFEEWYLRNRIMLGGSTLGGKKTCVATELRQLLSTPGQAQIPRVARKDPPPCSPRLDALSKWFKKTSVEDLKSAMRDGLPRKTIVFTSYVNPAAEELEKELGRIWSDAVKEVGHQDNGWQKRSRGAISRLERTIIDKFGDRSLRDKGRKSIHLLRKRLENDEPLALLMALSSPNPKFERLLQKELQNAAELVSKNADDILKEWGEKPDKCDNGIVEQARRLVRIHRRDTRWLLSALATPSEIARFDGESSAARRGEVSFAFQTMVGPWVLVASRVGSEGIDLQTWARRLVHFDLEWNPAVMEQREGRCDRIGRRLKKDPLDIYYLVVKGTYDERMLHQVAVRQEWHRLILGMNRKTIDVDGDLPESLTQHLDRLKKLDLNLSPAKYSQ